MPLIHQAHLGNVLAQTLCGHDGARLGGLRRQDRKPLAANPPHQIDLAHRQSGGVDNHFDDLVCGSMTMSVIEQVLQIFFSAVGR